MPKKAKELSGLVVSRLKSEGMYAVGGVDGLYLRIRNQSRAWVLCVAMGTRINNLGRTVPRRLNMGLGPYPEVSLAEARDKARELRKQIRNGINPLQEKHEQKARQEILARKKKTFAECCEEVLEVKDSEMKNKNISRNGVPHWKPMPTLSLAKRPLVKSPKWIFWQYWNLSG